MELHENQLSPDPGRLLLDERTQRACVEACFEAEVACVACADASLAEPDIAELRRCIRLTVDAADIAGASARLLARRLIDSRLLRAQVEACARTLSSCADACHEHANSHEHCRKCAAACRHAAERCGAVLRELPDAWGQTHPKAPSAE